MEEIIRNKLLAGAAMKSAIKGLLGKCELCIKREHGKNHQHSKLTRAMEHWCNGTNPRENQRVPEHSNESER